MKYDHLIVGAGLFVVTFTWRARQAGKTCLVIDCREYTGGNTDCEQMEGINVHRYGMHIFYTKKEEIWRFVNLVPFNCYTNSSVANYQGNAVVFGSRLAEYKYYDMAPTMGRAFEMVL